MRARVLLGLATVLFGLALPAGNAASGNPAPPSGSALSPVCAEPFGQTDTGPHPRVQRAVVGGVPVAVVLPPGYGSSDRRHPVVYLLHGAQGDEDSWIEYGGLLGTTAALHADDQPIVVLPRMGVVTGLAVDWVDGFRSDATLVGRTLVDWVDRTYRTEADRAHRAVAGYSGGGLSAAHLAERFPDVFGQLGILSAPLDLRNPVSAPATFATMEAEKLCAGDDPAAAGPLGSPITHPDAWRAVDPLTHVQRLRDTTVWLSSGNGVPCSVADAADLVYPTAAGEPSMRQQAEAFSTALTTAGVPHTHQRRACGLHWWSTWRPDLATALQVFAREWRA